jgi:MFS family permease
MGAHKREGTLASTSTGHAAAVDDIVARLERLPTSWWQVKARIIVGVATFFDAFDALAIATVLPVIVPLWKLTPQQIGFMISAGFVGQLIGALLFGWVAERYGRMTAMIWSIALFAVMSLVCAFARDYNSLLVFRTIQGIGLGGEVPVAAVFISELAKAKGRGRFVLLYELVFPIGLVSASLVGLWVVPQLGWQWMFVIGALPAFLALVLRWLLPESPRWLAVRGHTAEAQAAMALIERETEKATGKPLPPPLPVIGRLELTVAETGAIAPATQIAVKISGAILGVLSGLMGLRYVYVSVASWGLGGNQELLHSLVAFGIPIASIVGGGIAFVAPVVGGVLMLLSAGAMLALFSPSSLIIALIAASAVGGGLALIAAAVERHREVLADFFGPLYLRRTLVVWVIWFAAYFVNYGLSIWLPTVYRTVFQLPLDVALRYGLITQVVGLLGTLICALTIDHVGRRLWFAVSFAAATLALAALAMSPAPTAQQVLVSMTIAYFFVSTINIGVYLYTPELYPTRVRALGVGTATAWLRLASIIGPIVVGQMIGARLTPAQIPDLPKVFLAFAAVAAIAALITALFAVETKGRVLEEASP